MGPLTFWEQVKDLIGTVAWKTFLWSMKMTQEEYWEEVYKNEKAYREKPQA